MAVYVIECAGLLKIGYSDNPERRTAKLFQSASRYSAPKAAFEARGTQRLVCVVPGATKDDESVIHTSLREYSIGCEWFVNEPAVLEYVQAFTPRHDRVTVLERPEGPAWDTLPAGEHGGAHYELCLSVAVKRNPALAAFGATP